MTASQTRTVPSWQPETMTSRSPARPMATAFTAPSWPASGPPTGSPVTASQTRTVPSSEPETMTSRSPARPMATAFTAPPWPASGSPTGAPVTASQTRTVPSLEPETMTSRSPARPIATAYTGPSWPASGPPSGAPVTASQTRTVPSPEPETMTSRSPARPMATAYTAPSWPVSGAPTGRAGDRIPDPHRPVVGAGDDDVAVPGPPDRHRVHPAAVAGQRAAGRGAGDRVPDPHRAIVRAGDDDVPVPGPPQGHRIHRAAVAGQRAAVRVAGDRVPDPDRPIVGAGDDDVAVPGPPHGHRDNPSVVAGQPSVSLAGPCCPADRPFASGDCAGCAEGGSMYPGGIGGQAVLADRGTGCVPFVQAEVEGGQRALAVRGAQVRALGQDGTGIGREEETRIVSQGVQFTAGGGVCCQVRASIGPGRVPVPLARLTSRGQRVGYPLVSYSDLGAQHAGRALQVRARRDAAGEQVAQALMAQHIPRLCGRVIVAAAQERPGGLLDEHPGRLR